MVDFIKPRFLGTLQEFKERFIDPIKSGQAADADQFEVRKMRNRCHVLHTQLKGLINVSRLKHLVILSPCFSVTISVF